VGAGAGAAVAASAPADVDLSATAPEALPLALARVHRATPAGGRVRVLLPGGLTPERHHDVVHGAGFRPVGARRAGAGAHLAGVLCRERTLPSYVAPGLRLVLCGLNPSLYAADAGVGFARPGNRFWPALVAAGLTSVTHDPLHLVEVERIGMTDLVKRATPRADALTTDEYRAGVERLHRVCAWLEPAAVCLLGLDGWRRAVNRRARPGWLDEAVGGRPAYLMPNPSGLNAHSRLSDFVAHLRAASATPR
jgi:double-stranded uracil-DNA glycosylase